MASARHVLQHCMAFFFVLLAARRHHTHHLHIPELLQPFVPEQLEITLPQYKLAPDILALVLLAGTKLKT